MSQHKTADGVRYLLTGDAEEAGAARLAEDYLGVITRAIQAHPRSLQKEIGPSEIGNPCNRAVLYKLAGTPEPARPEKPNWKATIGTAVHAYLDQVFEDDATTRGAPGYPGRWLTERPVQAGTTPGVGLIAGATDLFDTWTHTVLDHKIIGKYSQRNYRANGPSDQYRVQANIYGYGWERAGYPVKRVAIAFLPREGELSGDTFLWVDDYKPQVAEEALQRLAILAEQLRAEGLQPALARYAPCTNRFCDWCGTRSSWQPRATPTTTAGLIGLAGPPAPRITVADLLAAPHPEDQPAAELKPAEPAEPPADQVRVKDAAGGEDLAAIKKLGVGLQPVATPEPPAEPAGEAPSAEPAGGDTLEPRDFTKNPATEEDLTEYLSTTPAAAAALARVLKARKIDETETPEKGD